MPVLSYDSINVAGLPNINPFYYQTKDVIENFCRDHHIWLPNFEEYHSMTAYLYPRTSAERFIVLNIFMNLLWYVDDMFDDNRLANVSNDDAPKVSLKQLFALANNAIMTGSLPENAPDWLKACAALHDKIMELDSEWWLDILQRSLQNHLYAITNTIKDADGDNGIDLDRYLEIREHDSGMYVAIDGIDFACDHDFRTLLERHEFLRVARHCVANIGGLMNDLMSYHKDERDGNAFNLIAIIRAQNDDNVKIGIHGAVEIINNFIKRFEMCEQHVDTIHDEKEKYYVQLYLRALRDQFEASWHWQLATNRYRSNDAYYAKLKA